MEANWEILRSSKNTFVYKAACYSVPHYRNANKEDLGKWKTEVRTKEQPQRIFSPYLSHYVFLVDECFKTTYGCLIIQRKNILCFNGYRALIGICLKNNDLKKKKYP